MQLNLDLETYSYLAHLLLDNNLNTFTLQFLFWTQRCIFSEHISLGVREAKKITEHGFEKRLLIHPLSDSTAALVHSVNINSHPSGIREQKNNIFIGGISPLKIIYTFTPTQ